MFSGPAIGQVRKSCPSRRQLHGITPVARDMDVKMLEAQAQECMSHVSNAPGEPGRYAEGWSGGKRQFA